MWPSSVPTDIKSRIEALESNPLPVDVGPALDTLREEIVALRATQDASSNRVELLEGKMKDLTLAVAEGIENVARKERRIGATLARARKELRDRGYEDPGLDAEAHELSLVDGAGGESDGVRRVPEDVEDAKEEASSIKGVTKEELRRARGMF